MWFEYPYSAAYMETIRGGAAEQGLVDRVGDRVGEKVGIKVGDRVGIKVGIKLTANQERILEILAQQPRMTAPELAEIIGISKRKIEQNVASLKKSGRLRRIGPRKTGHWEVVE
jgi:ATP-dependent DNA helicase RecG